MAAALGPLIATSVTAAAGVGAVAGPTVLPIVQQRQQQRQAESAARRGSRDVAQALAEAREVEDETGVATSRARRVQRRRALTPRSTILTSPTGAVAQEASGQKTLLGL